MEELCIFLRNQPGGSFFPQGFLTHPVSFTYLGKKNFLLSICWVGVKIFVEGEGCKDTQGHTFVLTLKDMEFLGSLFSSLGRP